MNPLEQLADVTTPEPVSWWPLSIGYWLVILFGAIVIIATAFYVLKRYRYRHVLRECIEALRKIPNTLPQTDSVDCDSFHYRVDAILKIAHRHYTHTTQGINGNSQQWITILQQSFDDAGYRKKDYVEVLSGNHLAIFNGQSKTMTFEGREDIRQAALFWLTACLLKHVNRSHGQTVKRRGSNQKGTTSLPISGGRNV